MFEEPRHFCEEQHTKANKKETVMLRTEFKYCVVHEWIRQGVYMNEKKAK